MGKIHLTMKSQINKLIDKVTRALGGNQGGGPLREHNFISSLSPDYVMPRPFKDLPNVSKLWMRTNRMDPLLSKFGVAKKLAPEMAVAEYSWKIKAANRYLRMMHNKLESLLRSPYPNRFWVLALELMKRSRVLRALALRKLDHNWHRNMKFGLVKILLKRLDDSIQGLKDHLFIVRQYEDKMKSDGTLTHRPVGAPAYVDRMYMYIWQCFMVMYISAFVNQSQHAYRPGKGVVTALAELKTLLSDPKYKYAWEFDLKGAFPSVNINWTMSEMKALGLPAPIADYLLAMSIVTVERVDLLPEDQKGLLPEPKFDRQVELLEQLPNKFRAERDLWGVKLTEETTQLPVNYVDRERVKVHMKYEPESSELWELLDDDFEFLGGHAGSIDAHKGCDSPAALSSTPLGRELLLNHNQVITTAPLRGPQIEAQGFPQGAGMSPVMFIVVFEHAAIRGCFMQFGNGVRVLSYADDFIVFSEYPIPDIFEESDTMKAAGLKYNLEKSRCIKSDGEWLVPKFKYLGVTFHTDTDPIRVEGTPRSGATLHFDKMEMVDDFIARDKELKKIGKVVSPEIKLSSQQVLDRWGNGEFPFRLIPGEVIDGSRPITEQELEFMKAAAMGMLPSEKINVIPTASCSDPVLNKLARDNMAKGHHPTEGMRFDEAVFYNKDKAELLIRGLTAAQVSNAMSKKTMEAFNSYLASINKPLGAASSEGNFSASEAELVAKAKAGKPLTALGIRIAGMIVNRLHGGGWKPMVKAADRSLKPSPTTDGTSWIERIQNLRVRVPSLAKVSDAAMKNVAAKLTLLEKRREEISIYNSTTFATKDLLDLMKDSSAIKSTKKGFTYK